MPVTTRTLAVPGARLYYEVRGRGPLLLLIGAPMASGFFAGLAEQLAAGHTVLSYDPRGISRSPLDGPAAPDTPEMRADDVRRLILAAGGGPADVFGSSGGAITGLALVERHPGLVGTLVAHEPPLIELLPDADGHRAQTSELLQIYRDRGADAAMAKFLANAGIDPGALPSSDDLPEPVIAQLRRDNEYFLGYQLLGTVSFRPDLAALKATSTRVVVGAGATSAGQTAHRTAAALAERLGAPLIEFPGDHGGFVGHPAEFAAVLERTLAGPAGTG